MGNCGASQWSTAGLDTEACDDRGAARTEEARYINDGIKNSLHNACSTPPNQPYTRGGRQKIQRRASNDRWSQVRPSEVYHVKSKLHAATDFAHSLSRMSGRGDEQARGSQSGGVHARGTALASSPALSPASTHTAGSPSTRTSSPELSPESEYVQDLGMFDVLPYRNLGGCRSPGSLGRLRATSILRAEAGRSRQRVRLTSRSPTGDGTGRDHDRYPLSTTPMGRPFPPMPIIV